MNADSLITRIQTTVFSDGRAYCLISYAGDPPARLPLTAQNLDFLRQLPHHSVIAPDISYSVINESSPSPPSGSDAPFTVILWPDPDAQQIRQRHAPHIKARKREHSHLSEHISELAATVRMPTTGEPATRAGDPANSENKPQQERAWGDPPVNPPWRRHRRTQPVEQPPPPEQPEPTPSPQPEPPPDGNNASQRPAILDNPWLQTAGLAIIAGILIYAVFRIAT